MTPQEAEAELATLYKEFRQHRERIEAVRARREACRAELAEMTAQLQDMQASWGTDLAAYQARRAELEGIIAAALEVAPGA